MNTLLFSLFFTDLFIFLFKILNNFLNTNFPKSPEEVFLPYYSSYVQPEYEIQVYLLLLIFFIALIWFYCELKKFFIKQPLQFFIKNIYLKIFFIIPLMVFFFINIGDYPRRELLEDKANFLIVYLLVIAILILILSYLFRLIKDKNKIVYKLLLLLIAIIIAISTFLPRFPIFFHDYSFIIGPILEIAHGKTIFTQITSQYGFLSILILGYLKRFGLFDIVFLPVIIWFLYIVEYFICFYLIFKISRSVALTLSTLFSILTINYFSLMHPPTVLPQTGPFRWLPLVLSIFFLFLLKDFKSKKFVVILSFLSFFAVDSGIYLILAYLLTIFISFIHRQIRLNTIVKLIGYLLLSTIGIFLLINIVNILFGYQFINPFFIFESIRTYSMLGFAMLAIPSQTYFWIVILLYFLAIIYHLSLLKVNFLDDLLLFSSQIMILSSIYYVGRSDPHNLFHISIFFILNLSILLSVIGKKLPSWFSKFSLLLFFIFLIVYPSFARAQSVARNIEIQIDRWSMRNLFEPEMKQITQKYYQDDAFLINKYLDEKEIVILSPDDAYLFYLTKKKNLLDINPQVSIVTKEELNFALKTVFYKCPKNLVADCRIFKQCTDYYTLNTMHFPSLAENEFEKNYLTERLNLIEKKCFLNYLPKLCSKHLCILEAQTNFSLLK